MSKTPKTHIVTINLVRDQVECNPRRLIVGRNDSILFQCKDKSPFAIHFHPHYPAEKIRYQSGSKNQVKATIRKDAPFDRYEYFVALCDKEMNIWTDDPDIIIPPTH
jgi:hypothetical protein